MIGISMSARAGTRQPFEWDRLFESTIARERGHTLGNLASGTDTGQVKSDVGIDVGHHL